MKHHYECGKLFFRHVLQAPALFLTPRSTWLMCADKYRQNVLLPSPLPVVTRY